MNSVNYKYKLVHSVYWATTRARGFSSRTWSLSRYGEPVGCLHSFQTTESNNGYSTTEKYLSVTNPCQMKSFEILTKGVTCRDEISSLPKFCITYSTLYFTYQRDRNENTSVYLCMYPMSWTYCLQILQGHFSNIRHLTCVLNISSEIKIKH